MESPYKERTGPRRVISATRNSFSGFAAAVRYEPAFRELLALCLLLVPAAFWLGNSGLERALLVGSLMVALVAELVNAAIEATVDRVSYERHPLAKRAKDIGSAAVMLSLVNAGVVWLLVVLS